MCLGARPSPPPSERPRIRCVQTLPHVSHMENWGSGEETETRAKAFLKWALNLGIFISTFCGTIELSMGLALGSFA